MIFFIIYWFFTPKSIEKSIPKIGQTLVDIFGSILRFLVIVPDEDAGF
jgi:hypothetical protein